MPPNAPPVQPQRKLSRDQVKEILERNAELFKTDENFVPYLIDLALYLLEYEYDWKESGAERPSLPSEQPLPQAMPIAAAEPPPAAKPKVPTSSLAAYERPKLIPQGTRPRIDTPPPSRVKAQPSLFEKRAPIGTPKGPRPAAITPGYRNCPHCGGQISQGDLLCPTCRNIVR